MRRYFVHELIFLLLIILGLLTLISYIKAADEVTLHVYPWIVNAGSSVTLQCRVQRHGANRAVAYGIVGWTASERSMEGSQSPITYEAVFRDVPCGVDTAYCAVRRVGGRMLRSQTNFAVSGC
jgi:hypothetical protein